MKRYYAEIVVWFEAKSVDHALDAGSTFADAVKRTELARNAVCNKVEEINRPDDE